MTNQETLEAIVDKIGIRATLELLSDVCAEKSDNVLVNWQDEGLAASWMRASKRINAASETVDIKALSPKESVYE